VERLDRSGSVRVVQRSSVYETEPVGEVRSQRDFYNAVVKVETAIGPHDLLRLCKRVERELGRRSGGQRHGPRPIDVDVLLIDGLELADDQLVVPHPELARRRFVLAPLLELDPDLEFPDGTSLAEALSSHGAEQRAERISSWS
jgi:2-amino-4-hydroxy-6-hydroxymethyldihydropteridine diphosphokinase